MLPAGDPTEEILKELEKFVGKGDIIIDGGTHILPIRKKGISILKDLELSFWDWR